MGALDWNDDGRALNRGGSGPPNRETLVVVLCPTCRSRRVTRHSVIGPVSHWRCNADTTCPTWKESADTGDQGKAHIA